MTIEEINNELLKELTLYRNSDTLSIELKKLLMCMVLDISYDRYKFLTEDLRTMCEAKAYEDACKHSIHFNPEKSSNAKAYVTVIIRSSFACVMGKHGNFKKTREVYET
jgi:hypothetical protein